jgi:hypothetical protein
MPVFVRSPPATGEKRCVHCGEIVDVTIRAALDSKPRDAMVGCFAIIFGALFGLLLSYILCLRHSGCHGCVARFGSLCDTVVSRGSARSSGNGWLGASGLQPFYPEPALLRKRIDNPRANGVVITGPAATSNWPRTVPQTQMDRSRLAFRSVRERSGVHQVAEIGGVVTRDVSLTDVHQKGEGRCLRLPGDDRVTLDCKGSN